MRGNGLWFGLIVVIPLIWAKCTPDFSLFPRPSALVAEVPTAEVLRDAGDPRGGP